MHIINTLILVILSIFTLRDIIAAFANLPRDKWYSNFLYGKYDRNLVKTVFLELGYKGEEVHRIERGLKSIPKQIKASGINEKNILLKLLYLISKYTMRFDDEIRYGKNIKSNYYIDTMEAATCKDDLFLMALLMAHLIEKRTNSKIEVVFVAKGGNVMLAQSIANLYGAQLVVVKDKDDDSRATAIKKNEEYFKVNFEGSWNLFEGKERKCIIVDCNTSSGSQIIDMIKEINHAIDKCKMKVKKPKQVFVLYRVDQGNNKIDEMFKDYSCELFRFFDFDEDAKEELSSLSVICNGGEENIYNDDCKVKLEQTLKEFRKNGRIKYKH